MRAPHLALLAAVVLTGVACGGSDADPSVGGSNTIGSATTAPPTDASSTTVAEPSTTASPATTIASTVPVTTPAPDDGLAPRCVERGPGREPLAPVVLPDTLGPLGAAPVVDLSLPTASTGGLVDDWPRTGAITVPGGVLVWMVPNNATTDVGRVVAVDADGVIRWQRCLDRRPSMVLAAAQSESGEALVLSYTVSSGATTWLWEVWSLADGRVTRTLDDLVAASGVTGPVAGQRTPVYGVYGMVPDALLLAPERDGAADLSAAALLRIDLATMTATPLAMPPIPMEGNSLGTLPDGRLAVFGGRILGSLYEVVAVQQGEGWTVDRDALQAARPAAVTFDYGVDGSGEALVGFDAFGAELWRRADLTPIRAEGFTVEGDGAVAVASTCGPRASVDDIGCPDAAIEGVDARTGRTLWRLEGQYGVSIVVDGVAFTTGPFDPGVAAPTVWTMIDTRTGRPVADDQRWGEPSWFGIGCCDSPEVAWVDGSVVFTVDEVHLQVWYPRQLSTPTVTASLA